MRIELTEPHKSIASLSAEGISDFALLIGRNGAGKTQIFEALGEGHASIAGIETKDIEMYHMGSFRSSDTGRADRYANKFANDTADAYLNPRASGPRPIEAAEAIFVRFTDRIEQRSGIEAREEFVRNLYGGLERLADFRIFAESTRSAYEQELFQQVLEPLTPKDRHGTRVQNQSTVNFGGDQAALLSTAMKLAGKLPHELTRDDIMRAGRYEGNTLQNSLSEVFTTYRVEEFIWAHKRIEKEPVSFGSLIAQYRSEHRPPWVTLREILSEMRDATGHDGLFEFDFSDPEDLELDMGNYEEFTFRAEMTNRSTRSQYEISSLSSGETVLMALCIASFNQYLGRRVPKLLLLDELDAVLHPSMVSALVSTLKTLFLPQGTKVLMTSHSPMTVAALDEADIFRVARTGDHVNVSRTTKAEAIEELAEGLATVDVGLRIAAYDEAKVTILTEGHNTKHLRRWADLNFPNQVRIFEQLEQHTSDSQLLDYGRLLGRMDTNTHFVIVWDCDAVGKAEKLRQDLSGTAKVTPFAFVRRPENKISHSGIENNYDESVLESFSIKQVDNDGTLLSSYLPGNRKSEFADHILQHGTPEDFRHFQGLHAVIEKILELGG